MGGRFLFVNNDKMVAKKPCFPIAFCEKLLYNGNKLWVEVWLLAKIIAFVSGKGGTGKTSVCAAMATDLALAGKKVLCIDCAVGLPSLDIPLGMVGEGCLSFREVCRGDYHSTQATVHPHFPYLQLLTAPIHCTPDEIDGGAFAAMLASAGERFDYILLDAPAGIGTMFRLAAENADLCLVVTIPDPSAMRAAGRVGQELELMGKTDVRLIVNRVNSKMLQAMKLTVDDVVDQTGLQLLGLVPVDTDVLEAAAAGKALALFHVRGAFAAVQRITVRMEGNPVKIPVRSF